MSERINHLTDANFKEIISNSEQPVLIDFWADWCGPCHAIAPVIDELAEDFSDKITVAKVNVDQNPEAAKKMGIRSIPSLYIFKDGKAVAHHAGVASYANLSKFINDAI